MTRSGWQLAEGGPSTATKTVLLLPGSTCTAAFYAEVMAEPLLAGVHLVAATPPGQGGTRPPEGDVSVENYARLASELAADVGADVVVGHSTGANVALEMAGSGQFGGPVVLLAPSLSRADESMAPRMLDKLASVLGTSPFRFMLRIARQVLRGGVAADRLDVLAAEVRKNDPGIVRRQMHLYLRYLDRHGSLAPRLCTSGVPSWVVLGEKDNVGLTDAERRTLQDCPNIRIVTIAGCGHMIPNQQPARVAELVNTALEAATGQQETIKVRHMAVPMSMNRVIHGAVRRDLDRFADALAAFHEGDSRRAAQLGAAWRFFRDQLTRHHVEEHAIAWPPLQEVGVDPELLVRFDREHDLMAAALESANEAMTALEAFPTADSVASAASAIRTLKAVTEDHLEHEEAELEPVYEAKKDTPEIKAMGREFGKVGPKVGGNFFAWVQNGANADEQAALRASVPAPVLALIGGLFGREYRRNIAPVWPA
jgi:pimeloyl-ACP methyl ester carboxylesterase